jgi:WD40 repeat protein
VLYRSSRASGEAARDQLVQSYVQQGRRYLVDGDYLRALPYLAAAYAAGEQSPAVRFMLHRAMRLADAPVLRTEHHGRDAAFRPGGTEVLWVGEDGDAAVIELATGRRRSELAAPPGTAPPGGYFGVVSTDGTFTAIARPDGVVLWDGTSSRMLPVEKGERIALDGDARRLAIASAHEVSVWDVTTGQRAWGAPLATGALRLVWDTDALVVVGHDRTAWLLGPTTRRELGQAEHVVVGRSGMFAMLEETSVEIRDPRGDVVSAIQVPKVPRVAFSDDGTRIAIADASGAVVLHETASGRVEAVLVGHSGKVRLARFTGDGRRLVTTGLDQTVRVWDVDHHRELARYVGLPSEPASLRITADAHRILVVTNESTHVFPIEDPGIALAIDAGEVLGTGHFVGDRIFTTSGTGVELWNRNGGARIARIDVHVSDGAHASPDGQLAVIPIDGTNDTELRHLPDGALRARLASTSPVQWSAFDPAGQRIATANLAGAIELWNLAGVRVRTMRGHTSTATCTAFSPDGQRVVSASSDGTARVWDVGTGRQLTEVHHRDEALAATFDTTGDRILTSSSDGHVRLWDVRTSELVSDFADTAPVLGAAISEDDALVITAANDGVVHVWDVASGQELARFRHGADAQAADLAGDRLLTTSLDHRAIVWDVGRASEPVEGVTVFVRCHAPYVLRDTHLESVVTVSCP